MRKVQVNAALPCQSVIKLVSIFWRYKCTHYQSIFHSQALLERSEKFKCQPYFTTSNIANANYLLRNALWR